MGVSKAIKEAITEAKICLDTKGVGWLINDLNVHPVGSDKHIGGKYVYDHDKNTTDIYLEPKTDELSLTTVFLHECGHRLYTEEFTPAERKEIRAYYNKLRKRYSLPSITDMIDALIGEPIEKFGVVQKVTRPKKGEQFWVFELDSDDVIEVEGLDSLEFFFYRHSPTVTDQQLEVFPTSYSYTDNMEWFAEVFAFWCEDDVPPSLDKFLSRLLKPYARKTI